MRERTSLWMQKESGIKSVAFMQGAFNCKVNWEFIKNVNNKVHTPVNALFIKLDEVLNFTLIIYLTCSYMFRSTTIIRELSLEPS